MGKVIPENKVVKKLKRLDWDKWQTNTLVFVSPLAIMYLVYVAGNINLDGFQYKDFEPNSVLIGAMTLYLINVLLDFFKKFKAAN